MGSADHDERARRERAEARRAAWPPGEVITTGAPKPPLHPGTSAEERLARAAELSERVWVLSGRALVRIPRAELPGEIYEIRHADTPTAG